MKRISIFGITAAVGLLLALPATRAADSKQFGKIDSAKKLIGRAVDTTQGQKIGEVKDVIVDLESGRILYTAVSAGGDDLIAVAPGAFTSSTDAKLTINVDKEKLQAAPRFTKDQESKLGDSEFAKQVYQAFGQTLDWQGTFNNAHKASEIIGMNVKNTSDQKIGDINDLGIDLTAGRVAFVILGAGGVLGVGEKQFVLPPNAFTLAADKKSLATGIEKDKLAGAPQFNNNWDQLSNPRFAARVYQHWGKQPYWDASLAPTGRDESRVYDNQQNTTVAQNSAKDNKDNNGLRVRRNANARNQASALGLTSVEDARRLIGMDVRNAANEDLGKLQQIVVDLESGRALYGVVNLKGAVKPVTLQSLALAGDDKSLRFKGDANKLKTAPEFGDKSNFDLASADFINRVYTHYGQEHNWFDASGKFNNVHRVKELFNAKVQNSQGENLGQVQDFMIDLANARVLYVIVSAPALAKGDNLLAIPPNAFSKGSDQKTLVTGLDKAKLEAAPRVARANLRELANATKATEIYQYYGKEPYWNASGLAPTGR